MSEEFKHHMESPETNQPERDPYSFEVMIQEALENAKTIKSGQHNYPIQKLAMWAMLERYIYAEGQNDENLQGLDSDSKEYRRLLKKVRQPLRELSAAIVEQLNTKKEEYDNLYPDYKPPFALRELDEDTRKLATLNSISCSTVFGCCGGCKKCASDSPIRRRENLITMPFSQKCYFFDEYFASYAEIHPGEKINRMPALYESNDLFDDPDMLKLIQYIKDKYRIIPRITTSITKGSEESFKEYISDPVLRRLELRVSLQARTKEFLEPFLAGHFFMNETTVSEIGLDENLIESLFKKEKEGYILKHSLGESIKIIKKEHDADAEAIYVAYVFGSVYKARSMLKKLLKQNPSVFGGNPELSKLYHQFSGDPYFAVSNFGQKTFNPIENFIYFYSKTIETVAEKYNLLLQERDEYWASVGLTAYQREIGEIGIYHESGTIINPFLLFNNVPLLCEKTGQKAKDYPQDRLIVPFYDFCDPPKTIKAGDRLSLILENCIVLNNAANFDNKKQRQMAIFDGENYHLIKYDDNFIVLSDEILDF